MPKKVMLADDDEGVRFVVGATLDNDERYTLITADDGAKALELAKKERPDILFLDIMMPGTDGISVCRALKSDPSTAHVRVVMLTALSQDHYWKEAVEAGADDYFTKPFSPTALLRKVDEALELG